MSLKDSLGRIAIKEGVKNPDLIHTFLLEFRPSPVPDCIFVVIDPPGTSPLDGHFDRGPFLDGVLHGSSVMKVFREHWFPRNIKS